MAEPVTTGFGINLTFNLIIMLLGLGVTSGGVVIGIDQYLSSSEPNCETKTTEMKSLAYQSYELFEQGKFKDSQSKYSAMVKIYEDELKGICGIIPSSAHSLYPEAIKGKANTKFALNDLTGAENDYRFVLDQINSKDAEAITGLGNIALQKHEPYKALEYYQQSLEHNYKSVDAWLGISQAYLKLERIDDAKSTFATAQIHCNDLEKTKVRIMEIYYHEQKFDLANDMALEILEEYPENDQAKHMKEIIKNIMEENISKNKKVLPSYIT